MKDIKITFTNTLINDNYDFNCSFFKINYRNITTLYITMYIVNVFKISGRPTKKSNT